MPSYITNIPKSTDLISNSQSQLQTNCNVIDSGTTQTGTGFSRNHVTMTDGTNGGLHNRIDFYQNISSPSISGYVGALYPLSVSSASELAYTNAGGTTQITSGSLAIWKGGSGTGVVTLANSASNNTNIFTFPNGIVHIYGVISSPATGNGTQAFPGSGFPNACLQVQLTGARLNSGSVNSVYINSISTGGYTNGLQKSGFAYTTTSANFTQIYYFAIGY